MTADQVMAFAKEKYTLILEKVLQHNKILDNYLKTLHTFDVKLTTLIQLLEQKGVATEAEFEQLHDHNTGWRQKDATESVVVGDVVWVDYSLTSDEIKEKVPAGVVEEKGMPIRIGAKAIIFEDQIIGKKLGEKFYYTHIDTQDNNKKLEFLIAVTKVKTALEGAFNGANTEARNGSDVDVASETEGHV